MPMRFEPPPKVATSVQLDCGCWRELSLTLLRPNPEYRSVVARCVHHAGSRTVVHVNDREFIVECDTCHWARWAGQERRNAHRVQTLHRKTNFDHRTRVHYAALPGMMYYRLVAPEPLWKEAP